MQNDNLENQKKAGAVKPNPSRYNKNTKQGQDHEKSFDAENDPNRGNEINTTGLDKDEIDLDRRGVSHPKTDQVHQFSRDQEDTEGQNNANDKLGQQKMKSSNASSQKDAGQRSGQFNQNQDDSRRQ